MEIQNSQEALFIAVEMERRAVSFYERALVVFHSGSLRGVLQQLRDEEVKHLERFEALMSGEPLQSEQSLLLSVEAAGLLFPGGLLEAARKAAFESRESLIRYAAGQEEIAIEGYQGFAQRCQGEAKEAFLSIAREEEAHLKILRGMLPPEIGA